MNRRQLATLLVATLVTGSLIGSELVQPSLPAEALSASDFDPGYIISDDLFYDGDAMTAAEIQTFLDERIGSCLTDRCLNVAVLPVTGRPASYSSGALVCTAIAGGTLTVPELIYRTQVACGISAKVILVMLQKEQSLVTSRAPSDWALRAAMGMGCPDTAPCDEAFSGLATQIMVGARQLHAYKAGQFARQPGTHFIQYHPNSSCGGTTVNIRNYATAALYNYTPYQPNAAALANLGGTGDGCSSYGNRNFWRFYNQWFGSSVEYPCTVNPSRDITTYWAERGGTGGVYGAPVSPGIAAGPASTTIGYYQRGEIYCTPRLGAVGILGELADKYDTLGGAGGPLGSPTSASTSFSAGGVSGLLQEFQRGTMLSSTATGTFAVQHGPVRDAWGARGGSGGALGWPTGDQEIISGGVRQQFANGWVAVPTGRSAIVLTGEIGTYWASGSNAALLGAPANSVTPLTAGGVSGSLQSFELGMVLTSLTTGTHAVLNGAIRSAWGAQNGTSGPLGWPTGERQSVDGGYRQDFQGGTVFASTSGVGAVLAGDIAAYWSSGSNARLLGFPTGPAATWRAGGVTGTLQYFELGMVLSSSHTGTHAVLEGPVRDAWAARGGSGGDLGWPTGSQQTVDGEIRQQFERGSVVISSGVTGEIAAYLAQGSNRSRLGSASGPAAPLTAGGVTGSYQVFQRGMVLSSSSSGTFAVLNGPIRVAWGAEGGTGGSLGWPVGDQEPFAGGIRQAFQHGVVVVPNGGTGSVLSGVIGDYWASGSNASRLGSPISGPTSWSAGGTSGVLQYFQRGMVLSSSTTGTFSVLEGPIRDIWANLGGSGGQLGWPVEDQESTSGGMSQRFERGLVVAPTGGTAVVLSGEIAAYWAQGTMKTQLGMPTSSPSSWNAGGVTGVLQYFERGMVLSSSATGTHGVLNGPIRTAWGSEGGSGGVLGWPTGEQQATSSGVQQNFQRGVLTVTGAGVPIVLTGTYYEYWLAGSNASLLGSPIAPMVSWSAGGVAGSYLSFERGLVMSSVETGTVAVLDGPIRTVWGAQDGSGGPLGWPIADQQSVDGGTQQRFQRGTVVVPATGSPYVIPG